MYHLKRGRSEDISKFDYLARRVHDLVGWHSKLYVDAKDYGLPTIMSTRF